MMNCIYRIVVLSLMIFMLGCTYQKSTVSPQSIKQCTMGCIQQLDLCKKTCINNCPNCSAASTCTATKNYQRYVHQKRIEGGIITRELNSYRDPLQCRKVTCNCPMDFITCKQGCTGIIHKQLV